MPNTIPADKQTDVYKRLEEAEADIQNGNMQDANEALSKLKDKIQN